MAHYTITDIAKMAGVSSATVSRVLTGSSGVNPKTRQMVRELIAKIGYQPSTIARSLAQGKTNMVALMIDDIRNPYYSELAFSIQTALMERGFQTMITNQQNNVKQDLSFLYQAQQYGFAGLIMTMVVLENDAVLQTLENISCPKVMLNRIVDGFHGDVVMQDSFQGGYIATKHLIELGHPRIAMLTGPRASSSSMQRLDGYKKAMAIYSLPIGEQDVIIGDLRMETGYTIGLQYAENFEKVPKAIVIGNDYMSIGFLSACMERGIKVPEQLSLVSFDDVTLAALRPFNLTTVRQDIPLTGSTAVDLLCKRIQNNAGEYRRVILDTLLVERGTTARYPSN